MKTGNATSAIASCMKPIVRQVHAKPIFGWSRVNSIGKMMPPTLDPEAVMPTAMALCFVKELITNAKPGTKTRPAPSP